MDFVKSYFGTNEPNVRVKKTETNRSSISLLQFVSFFLTQTLWPVEYFCPPFFPDQHWSGQKGQGGKKCSTGQRFVCIEATSYKIHTLIAKTRKVFLDFKEQNVKEQIKKGF